MRGESFVLPAPSNSCGIRRATPCTPLLAQGELLLLGSPSQSTVWSCAPTGTPCTPRDSTAPQTLYQRAGRFSAVRAWGILRREGGFSRRRGRKLTPDIKHKRQEMNRRGPGED